MSDDFGTRSAIAPTFPHVPRVEAMHRETEGMSWDQAGPKYLLLAEKLEREVINLTIAREGLQREIGEQQVQIHQELSDAKDDATRLHRDKMDFLCRLLTCRLRCGYIINHCRLRCGYIINHCRDHAQAKGEAKEMLRVIEGINKPTITASAIRECEWSPDDDGVYHTGCGQAWTYTDSGTPKEHGALFCYHCGGNLRCSDRTGDHG